MKKIELFQVGQTTIADGFTIYSAGIYWKRVSISTTEQTASPVTTIFSASWDTDIPTDPFEISGVSFKNIAFSELSSIEELYLQDGSYFFDFNNQLLYFCLFDYIHLIVGNNIQIGETIGFLNQAQLVNINGLNYPLNTFLGSVFYEPRLEDVSVVDEINDQKNGIFVFGTLEATIKNNDGIYDTVRTSLLGNKAILLIANISDSPEEEIETGFPYKLAADFDDFEVVRSGIVETVDYTDPNLPVIRAIDDRANWTQTIGTNLLTTTEFANLPEKYVNDRKALCIGEINGVEAVPLRDDSTAASFDYFICDTSIGAIQSVSAVYFKGQIDTGSGTEEIDRYLTITTEYTINLSTGIVTILNCIKGDVYIYGIFTTMEETVEIILFLLSEYGNTAYTDTNFNKTEIEEIQNRDYQSHVYIDGKGQTLSKTIEKLCADIKADMFQQGDVLTMRLSNVQRLIQEELTVHQIIGNPPSWNTNRTDTIKTITVNYNQDYRQKLFNTYYNDDNEQTAIDNNLASIDKSFDVNLTKLDDVTLIYELFYNRFIGIPRTVTINRTTPFNAGLGDFITFSVERNGTEIFVNGIYKITNIDRVNDSIEAVFFENSTEENGPWTFSYDSLSYTYLSGRG